MSHTPVLPYKKEFLLELVNNNYSQETVDNYARDLGFLESFLYKEGLEFNQLDKLAVSRYKGFLREGEHLKAYLQLRHDEMTAKEAQNLQELGLSNGKTPGAQPDSQESSLKAPKTNFTHKGGLSSRSVNRMLSSIRRYLKFLVDIDQPVPVPADAIKMLKTERKESQVAEVEDLIALIEAPESLETKPLVQARNRAMLELLFSSGMRISELVNLNREQLNIYGEKELAAHAGTFIAGKLYVKGKGKKSRFVYLTERAKHWLGRYLELRHDEYPALFIPYRGGRAGTKDPLSVRISINYLQERIIYYRRHLGIIVPTSAHSLRHGFATYLAEKGASPAAIQRLLGHESLQTTTRYVHTSDKFAEETHKQYHPLPQ